MHCVVHKLAMAVLVGFAALTQVASPLQAQPVVVDVGPSFPMGPYASLYVDRTNSERVAVGTMDGRIAWSSDGAMRVSESRVLSHRRYDAMAIRSGARSSLGGGEEDSEEEARLDPSHVTQRPVRLFLRTLMTGKGIAQWHYWMSITEPLLDIGAVFLPQPGGRMMIASSAGILVSDDKGGSWTKTLGAPGNMPHEKLDMVGLAIIAHPSNPHFVLAATTDGVFMSRDAGMNFIHHIDETITDEVIFDFIWDPNDEDVVLAVGPDTIFQSVNGGMKFELAYVAESEINAVVNSDEGIYIAATDGLTLVGADGNNKILDGESVIGVVPWTNGEVLVLLTDKLLHVDLTTGDKRILQRTSATDPFLRIDGSPGLAFLLSNHAVFRIGVPEERVRAKTIPVMALSGSAVQQAMLNNLGIGTPEDTRIHPRWYSKLLPQVTMDFRATSGAEGSRSIDYTLPLDFRFASADVNSNVEFIVFAEWDLSSLVFGDQNASNPNLFIESTLSANRDRLLMEVRNHYREATMLAHRLKNPPTDAKTALLWRMRLEEHASYLEFVSGKEVVKDQTLEPTK